MSGSASIRNSRMKFAKGVLSAFMAVVTVVGFTPIVPYHAYADESEPAQEQPAVQESNELQPATAEQVAPSAPADEQTPATGAVAANEEGTQLSAAGEDATSLEPMAGVSCIWNDTYYENVGAAVAAIEDDDSPTGGTITMIADSEEHDSITITEPISIDFAGKKVNLGHNTIYWNVEGSTFALDGAGSIVAETVTAIHIQKGSFVLNGGSVKVTGLNDDAAAVLVDEGENNGIAILSGSIESKGGFAVATHADMLFTGGDISSLCVGGSAQAHMSGTGGMNQQSNGLKPADVAGNPVIESAGKGVVVENEAEVHISNGAIIEAVDNAVTVDGGSVEVAGSYVASEDGSALAAIDGIATVHDDTVLSTEDNGVVYAGDDAFVTVSSDGDNYTLLSSDSGDMVIGNTDNVVCNEGVRSTDKVIATAVAEGFVCTRIQEVTEETLSELWEINNTPNLPVVKADSLPYSGEQQAIVDLKGATVLSATQTGENKMTATTDGGYTLEYDKAVGVGADSGTLIAKEIGDYRVIATLEEGLTWPDETTGVKVLEVSIVANKIAAPKGIDDLVYTVEEDAGVAQSLVDFPEGITLKDPVVDGDKKVVDTNMGYKISFDKDADITVKKADPTVEGDKDELTAVNADTYALTLALDKLGTTWADGSTDPITLNVSIAANKIAAPEGNGDLVYTAKEGVGVAQSLVDFPEGITLEDPVVDGDKKVVDTNMGYKISFDKDADITVKKADPTVEGDKDELTAVNADTYTLTLALKDSDNTTWADSFTGTLEVSIAPLGVPQPSAIGSLTYTGAAQQVIDLFGGKVTGATVGATTVIATTDAGYSFEYPVGGISYDEVAKQLVATDAGEYPSIVATLDENHIWSDAEQGEEHDPVTISAEIGKAVITVPTVTPEEGVAEWTGDPIELVDLKGAVVLRSTVEAGIVTAVTNKNYTLTYPESVSYKDGKLYAIAVRDYQITATRDSAANYLWSDDLEEQNPDPHDLSVEITKINVDAPTAVEHDPYVYDGEAKDLLNLNGAKIVDYSYDVETGIGTATTDKGYALTYADDPIVSYDEENGVLTGTDAGNYKITATLDGSHQWKDAAEGQEADALNFEDSIARKAIDKPEPATDPITWTGEERLLVSAGEGYTLSGEGVTIKEDGAYATAVGDYTITATLDGNYAWNAGPEPTKPADVSVSISANKVTAPKAEQGVEYDGQPKTIVAGGQFYQLKVGDGEWLDAGADAKATTAGEYVVYAKLVDPENYEWATDPATTEKQITTSIAKKSVEAPESPKELTFAAGGQKAYDGSDIYKFTPSYGEVTIKDDGSVWVTDTGEYSVVATLNDTDNYKWSDSEAAFTTATISVARKFIEKPTAVEGLVYNRAAQTLVAGGEGYTLGVYNGGLNLTALPEPDATFPEGEDATAIDAKEYTVIATLVDTDNYAWDDGLEAGIPGYDIKPVQLDTKISAAPISEATVTASNMAYTGAALEPAATVKLNSDTLTYDTDYTVAYSNNKEVGTATITVTGKGNYTGTATGTFKIVESVPMFRMYNPNSGEHFYTKSTEERDNLKKVGWQYEGIGWYAPSSSNTPVYRLYNPNGGDHHYTVSVNERDMLTKAGWKYEGIGWYSDDAMGVKVLREYNPNATSGSHNFTTSETEHQNLVKLGWRDEGTAWYAVAVVS